MEVRQPSSLRSEEEFAGLASLSPEVVVVAAYGLFLPPEALEIPPLGCLNIHPSLLPRYRGPSPVVSAILNGDDETGVTIMKLDEGMDSGPLLAQAKVQLGSRETGPELTRRLFDLGRAYSPRPCPAGPPAAYRHHRKTKVKQPSRPLSRKRTARSTGLTTLSGSRGWCAPTSRGPARSRTGTASCSRYSMRPGPTELPRPGHVVGLDGSGIGIGTGDGLLAVDRLQIEGRRPSDAQDFVRGYPAFVGSELGRSS